MKKYLSFYLLFLAIPLFSQVKVTSTSVNLRSTPEIKQNVICILPAGMQVTILEDTIQYTDWTKVSCENNIGFIYSKYIVDESTYQANKPQSEVKYYTNTNGEKVQSPTRYKSPLDLQP